MSDLRIYAACLSAYNNGVLHGVWIDCDGKDAADMCNDVNAMMRCSPFPNTEVEHEGRMVRTSEEFAIHDSEGFAGLLEEYTPLDDVSAIAEGLSGPNRLGFLWLVKDHGCTVADAVDQAESVMIHENDQTHNLLKDYAEDWAAEALDLDSLPDIIRGNIDYEGMGKEMQMAGQLEECDLDGHRFLVVNVQDF